MTDVGIPVGGRLGFLAHDRREDFVGGCRPERCRAGNKTALERRPLGMIGGFDNYTTAFIPTHTVGVATGTPLVNGASQSVTYATARTPVANPEHRWLDELHHRHSESGRRVHHRWRELCPPRHQGIDRAAPDVHGSGGCGPGAATGPAALTISPPIIISGAFQTVTAAPADNAAITAKTGTGGTGYKQGLLLDPMAITLVSRPLDIPANAGLKTSTKRGNKVVVSVSEWTNTLAQNMRFDVLWGNEVLDPGAACARPRNDNGRGCHGPAFPFGGGDGNCSGHHPSGLIARSALSRDDAMTSDQAAVGLDAFNDMMAGLNSTASARLRST